MMILALIIATVVIVIRLGLSWLFVCGILKLLSIYFSFEFSWGVATGLWIMLSGIKGMLSVWLDEYIEEDEDNEE